LLTAFSKLACGGGSVYIKAKYSAYYLNNVSKPGKLLFSFKKKRVPQQRSKCMTYGTEIPVDFLNDKHLSTAKVKEQCQETGSV